MVSQLTIPGTTPIHESMLDEEIARLGRYWKKRTSASQAVEAATRACAARFGAWRVRPLTPGQVARLGAYFNAVVRRRVLAGADESCRYARSVLVARSIEADLIQGGWTPDRALAEARRVAGLGTPTRDVA